MEHKSLSVICPVYNEEEAIAVFYQELKEVITEKCADYETSIIFVLDRSTDKTQTILEEICSNDKSTKLLVMSSRFGHQAALIAGIDNASSDVIVMMDSDLQHPPELIPEMLKAYHMGNDIVAGVRVDNRDKGFFSCLPSRLFYLCWNKFSGLHLSVGEADYRLISRRVALVFKQQLREQNQFLRGLFYWVGFNRTTVEFTAANRIGGKTKYTFSKLFAFAINSVASFSKWPLQFAIMIGLLSAIGAMVGFISIVFDYFFYGTAPSGWYTLATIIFFFCGLQILFIGTIGQYVGMIFDEVKNRPLYIIDRKINFDDM